MKWLLYAGVAALLASPATDGVRQYFGIGASVRQEQNYFRVITEGKSEKEGVVYSHIIKPGTNMCTYSLSLQGEGTVRIIVEQFQAKGVYAEEQLSAAISLTDEWLQQEFSVRIRPDANEADVFVVTPGLQKASFSFRNVRVSCSQ